MSDKDFSGPAFPSESSQYGPVLGMSLRDYFAAKAMQGLMGRTWEGLEGQKLVDTWAVSSYAVADAMLAERAK